MTEFPQAGSIPVSVLIPARNEEANMSACLASVRWASEIVVVDSNSQDRTCQISSDAGAQVLQFRYEPGGPKKKNWALKNFSFQNRWILILDADERITPGLACEIREVVGEPRGCDGFYINRRFFFMGRFIRHAGYFPSWNLRLLRQGFGEYEHIAESETLSGDNEVHEHIILSGQAGHLRSPMDHFAYPTIDHFLAKHMRYSNWEARAGIALDASASLDRGGSNLTRNLQWRRRLKYLGRKMPFPHWLRFWYHYFLKLGILDGKEGYIFCHLLAEYEFWTTAKQLELTRGVGQRTGTR